MPGCGRQQPLRDHQGVGDGGGGDDAALHLLHLHHAQEGQWARRRLFCRCDISALLVEAPMCMYPRNCHKLMSGNKSMFICHKEGIFSVFINAMLMIQQVFLVFADCGTVGPFLGVLFLTYVKIQF